MFYSLKQVGLDIQSHDAIELKEQINRFIDENSKQETVEISVHDMDNKVTVKISMYDIKLTRMYLETFFEEHDLIKSDELDDFSELTHEMFVERLTGGNKEYIPHVFWCGINRAIFILYLFKKANYEYNMSQPADDSWTPPENWANGTEDEQEAYKNFWNFKSNKGSK